MVLLVLSAMGCACSALPTAILSTHTAFDNPHRHMLTEDILPICRHWQSAGVSLDAITVGCLADPKQAEQVICATPEASPFGAEFESRLPWLWEQL